jgi:hypothetical protein
MVRKRTSVGGGIPIGGSGTILGPWFGFPPDPCRVDAAWHTTMIHYTVSFAFREGTPEGEHLGRVRSFLADLKSRGQIHDYRLLRNRQLPPKTRLPLFQADIVIADDASFGLPFSEVEEIGVHSGRHGWMIEDVTDMSVEVFDDVPDVEG